ncbi:unnamed protein product [Linum trigynum]|uniref:PGG domain-containing protein n=1 Tax=Linum trigynum TaxID=586398 RepID=A0AAV2DPX2_9ROSI
MAASPLLYLALLKATSRGDWETAERIFNGDPSARTARINAQQDTPLHVAVFNDSPQYLGFVRRLVEDVVPEDALGLTNALGDSALHSAAIVGNTGAAKLLASKAPRLLQLRNDRLDDLPIHSAARYCQADIVRYLLSVMANDTSFSGQDGVKLVNLLIYSDLYGLAVDALRMFPRFAREQELHRGHGETAILALAGRSQAFLSRQNMIGPAGLVGSLLHQMRRTFYYNVYLLPVTGSSLLSSDGDDAMELLTLLISEALKAGTAAEVESLLKPPMLLAAESGVYEVVIEIIKAYPVSTCFVDSHGRTVFHLGVLYRRAKVFNIFYQLTTASKNLVAALVDDRGNNLLHLAGMYGEDQVAEHDLGVYRELQWFYEVAKVVPRSYREMINDDRMTPVELFDDQQRQRMEKGQRRMQDTAGSFSFVAALVVTVSFAAVFTLPGGANDNGIPHYINKPSFMVFTVANALAFFSSSTSLVMVLSFMSSKYSAHHYPSSVMESCLLTLALSIAAMLVAFAASLHIVLYQKVSWIMAPIGVVAFVPASMILFWLVPPLISGLISAYGPNVLGTRHSDEVIA